MSSDVVIIGAGVAGLSAAAAVRAAGLSAVTIEATERIGGRAWTRSGGALGDGYFDLGASWLHAAERNPLAEIAQAHGDRTHRSEDTRTRRVFTNGRLATDGELQAYATSWERFESEATQRAAEAGRDVSLGEAIAPLRDDPWTATIEFWEASLIAAADSFDLSVQDWHRNLLDGSNLVVGGGIGAFVARRLGPPAGEIWRNTAATHVDWDRPGGMVAVQTSRGTITARACIVTVSTGVLASGGIRFTPPLPVEIQDAIDHLPMGLLSKVALRATGADRLDLPNSCSVQRRLRVPGESAMSFHAWPDGMDHIVGFVGGPMAWGLSGEAATALPHFATEHLAALFGSRARQVVQPADQTDWGNDPAFLGAYAYATPGHAGARRVLGTPVGDRRLIFAGEAVRTDGLAGTVGGAWLSGREAAYSVVEMMGTRVA
jgi:monoamine oxidase